MSTEQVTISQMHDELYQDSLPPPPQSQIAAALSKAQGEFLPIVRNKTVRVQTKTGGSYTFSYAPLENILGAVKGALAKHGLALTQMAVKKVDGEYVRSFLLHSSGEVITTDMPLQTREPGPQAYGSALTYARRYGITLLLCIVADDDDDGNAAEGNAVQSAGKSVERTKAPIPIAKPGEAKVEDARILPDDSELITVEQAKKLHMRFRDELREELKADADKHLHGFLEARLYFGPDGKPSAKAIPKALYTNVGKEAVEWARSL